MFKLFIDNSKTLLPQLTLKISKTCKTNRKGSVDYDMLSSALRTVGFAYSADVDLSGLYSYLIT